MKLLVLLSGPVAVGKSSVATDLIRFHNFGRIGTGNFLIEVASKKGISNSRTGLQQLGDALDEQTDYRWVVDDVAVDAIEDDPGIDYWLLDSVRKERQVQHFRARYGSQILHVHLTAPEALLQERYDTRLAKGGEYTGNTPYSIAIQHPNEVSSRNLIEIADVVIDVAGLTSSEVVREIFAQAKTRRI